MSIFSILYSLFLVVTPTKHVPVPNATLDMRLPSWQTQWEKNKDSSQDLYNYRLDHPEFYGITVPPPAGFGLYPEFSAVDRIYLVYTDDLRDYYVNLIREASYATQVYVIVGEDGGVNSVNTILSNNLTPTEMTNVHLLDFYATDHYVFTSPAYDSGIDAIWTVDFGPFYLVNSNNDMVLSDAHYYPDRINDDAAPSKLGSMNNITVYRPDLYIEGGNLIADGLGNCYTTTVLQEENTRYSATELETVLDTYFGCHKVVWLQPQTDEGTGHIDMFFILADAHTAIVGEYTTAQDSVNKTVLDQNATLLSSVTAGDGSPLTVLRIPMPNPGSDSWGRVWRTYTNGLRINGKYLMPVYPSENSQQANAVAVVQSALPGVDVVEINSDSIISWGGAIHCTTRTRPVANPLVTADPDFLCEGKPVCDNCEDECSEGETGCMSDGSRFVCGQNDEDSCLDKISLACPASQQCNAGSCGDQTCTDECLPGETGCDGTGARWICTEAGDSDSCLEMVSVDCGNGRECQSGICVDPSGGCGDVDYDGECQGNVSVYCDANELVVVDCQDYGMQCNFLQDRGWYDCTDPVPCTDECAPGESSCGTNEGEILHCAELFDGDSCLEWKSDICETGMTCSEDQCVSDCQDECSVEDAPICMDSTTLTTCVLSENTGCYTLMDTPCGDGEICGDGQCRQKVESGGSSGCSCSTGKSSTPSSGLIFFFMLIFSSLWFVRRSTQL